MKKCVVVIGSGLAGSLICNELVKNSSVILLESGLKNSISYPKTAFIHKHFGPVKTFCIGGGGTTNIWHNGLKIFALTNLERFYMRSSLTSIELLLSFISETEAIQPNMIL